MIRIIILLLLLASVATAQNVYFCKSYTERGVPIEASINMKIKPGGSEIYILLDNDGEPIHDNMIYLFIDKNINGEFEPFDSKPIDIREGRTWAVFEYRFNEEGEYKANFVNTKNRLLASGKVNILYDKTYFKPSETYNPSYYDYSRIVFSKAIIDDKPFDIKDAFQLIKGGTMIFAYLNTGKQLNTEKIFVEVYVDENGDREFDQHIDSKKYKVDPGWRDTFFRYTVKKAGMYKFEIYNENNVLMGSSFVSVYQ
ncbi:MAG: hypothetical protein SCALA702_26070 [Melioribacteraceae bacterium]|nr:MAG: hypothetical protein SCALA702_26070 [Melioribacteraceae bacterium]